MDIIGQRFRAIEASILEEGRLERCAAFRSGSQNQSELGDSRPTGHDGGGGASKPPSQTRLAYGERRDPHCRPWSGYANARDECWTKPAATENADGLSSAVDPVGPKEKGKSKSKGKSKGSNRKKEDVESEQQQPSSACCLADVSTADTIPEDGHYSGRSRCVLGGQRGWSTPWQVNDATFQSQQNTVENYGKKLKTPAGRWLRWRLHDVRSKVLYCLGREGQPCHGGGIVRAFAEAKSEEEQT